MANYVELPIHVYEELKPFLRVRGIACEASDCTPAGMSGRLVHLEFAGDLRASERNIINQELDRLFLKEEQKQTYRYREMEEEISHPDEGFTR